MTNLLHKAFAEASKLPDTEQNALAKWLLEELEADKKWGQIFAESEDILERLADEALEADRQS
jgi:replication fork clamp-binding protein CrfC